jgi:K(+)-stimulated pyrophosphate-energized sodium pump
MHAMHDPVFAPLLGMTLPTAFWIAPIAGVCALLMALVFSRTVLAKDQGDAEMVRIARAVRDGAMAYLGRQYRVVLVVFAVLVAVLGVLSFGMGLQPTLSMIGVPVAGLLSGLCGWFGMRTATSASNRTAAAAKVSLNDGLTVAFRSGAVMGLTVVGFACLDVSVWLFMLTRFGEQFGMGQGAAALPTTTSVMLSFAMGASLQALFARVGGGIYTKAADVGADLVGKVEAGIPEDDPRNPATIADNVGDNVGDVAGMGADLYESYYGSILSTMALGAAAAFTIPNITAGNQGEIAVKLVIAPLALAGVGILCSILGIFTVRAREGAGFAELLRALGVGVWTASALIAGLSLGLLWWLLNGVPEVSWLGMWGAIMSGLIAGLIIARATEYSTSYEHPPTRRIAEAGHTGPATVIIAGIAEGMKSTWAALLTTTVAVLAAFVFSGGGANFLLGLYGVAIAAVGMLATLGITLATDAYGPIADNAGGNAEMSGQPAFVRERTDMLDSLGNTTAATGKGFAIGSAALTALALFAAYIQVVQVQITTQSAAFMQPYRYAGETPKDLHAVYEGHGKFAIVNPVLKTVGGGMLVDVTQFDEANEVDHLEVGLVLPASVEGGELEGRLVRLNARVAHGEHFHNYNFAVVDARFGSIRDVLMFYDVTLTSPRVLAGLFLGVLLTFLFCALTMGAVGRAAYAMMAECRRQFAAMRAAFRASGMSEADIADPMKWPMSAVHEGVTYPDYARCVSISTAGAQREMILPSVLAVVVPLGVGMVLGVGGVMGLLAGGLTSGFAVAIFMANAGGAWDNAKKFVESCGKITADRYIDDSASREAVPAAIRESLLERAKELRRTGRGASLVYGKGSDDHKACVVGDTVGDPFKDTSGPSLNILIKLISIVSVVFAGLTVKFGPVIGAWIGLH